MSSLKAMAELLVKDPKKAQQLQMEINKIKTNQKPTLSSLATAGAPVSEPIVKTHAAKALAELAEKEGFEPDAESMEYKGSKANEIFVRAQIAAKFGDDHAEEYEPTVQVKPKTAWLQAGWLLIKDEEPLCHITTWRKNTPYSVALYHQLQMFKG